VDLARAPRRALVVTLQLAAVLLVGVPLAAVTQPFLPAGAPLVAIGIMLAVLGISFWRSAANLQGHVRAGAQVIVEALASQSRRGAGSSAAVAAPVSLERVSEVLPGLGELEAVHLGAGHPAIGRTLADLNLRGYTGATVLAITRPEGGVLVPTAGERLREGDVLALAGSREAIDAAKSYLAGGAAAPSASP
jgi:CPA2 family monovalent cation:H+ antiporter-2